MAEPNAEPSATIRPVASDDQKKIRFLVGKMGMEPIAVANQKMYFNPLVVALWVALSSVWVQWQNWWPRPELGLFGYLTPVPAFGALSIVFMFAIDWLNRWGFEDRSSHVLRSPDLVDIPAYYSRSPASGFWVLEYNSRLVGFIALDASLDAASDAALDAAATAVAGPKSKGKGKAKTKADPTPKRAPATTKGTAAVASIRHFYVDEPYRPADMADDLLSFALEHAFGADKTLEAVRAHSSPLQGYVAKSLAKHGFVLDRKTERVGALRWQSSIRILARNAWEARKGKQ
ncbi:uncharacterized protein BXZ73DRAFT_96916 [Epithele typhae]|uniref:uncharacterized protein n=1 Tax=Epithele typhae TaxID=378194 RepID=UPI0020075EBA|nr:uncharacterized protein BXZ73DRAFT_96916 [Epithele typhae]KAH9944427.1 hypothetical protein BXZ73DRAFT_96916 [Epithele typhae]